jgi:hypothetical protein
MLGTAQKKFNRVNTTMIERGEAELGVADRNK